MKRFLLFALLLVPSSVLACLWDYDTLKQEQARFPDTLELLTGRFLRHSKEFYQWRIDDRLARLKGEPNQLELYDDLAVAYQKVGKSKEAIETMLKKEQLKPGVYETYSNLGTFYILEGDFAKGLPYIDQALKINPEAHFGREKYQKWLVEYATEKMKEGKLTFPMNTQRDSGFDRFLLKKLNLQMMTVEARQEAVKGVLGMMRFANHENPLLLEVLGDLLHELENQTDAKQLASRAYLKASYGMKDEAAQVAYRKLAKEALEMQVTEGSQQQMPLAELEAEFQKELAEADRWYAKLYERELNLIRQGKDVEGEFDKLYLELNTPAVPRDLSTPLIVLGVGILALGVAIWRRR